MIFVELVPYLVVFVALVELLITGMRLLAVALVIFLRFSIHFMHCFDSLSIKLLSAAGSIFSTFSIFCTRGTVWLVSKANRVEGTIEYSFPNWAKHTTAAIRQNHRNLDTLSELSS